ncbi:MAG: hypothetical protein JNL98_35535 [Bryobacterales bacterium]|nr:hypothetical protein [Bryobacterales bacterium]
MIRIYVTVVTFLIAGGPPMFVLAQPAVPSGQKALTNLLPPDHAGLYRQFFYFHHGLSNWLATTKARRSPNEAVDLDRKAAAVLRMTPGEHQQVATITAAVGAELRAIERKEQAHANMRARYEMPPVASMVQQFEAEKADAVNRGTARLRALPPGIWRATQDYINGDFRVADRSVP